MSYCTGKNIEKSRGKAMKMLAIEKRPVIKLAYLVYVESLKITIVLIRLNTIEIVNTKALWVQF